MRLISWETPSSNLPLWVKYIPDLLLSLTVPRWILYVDVDVHYLVASRFASPPCGTWQGKAVLSVGSRPLGPREAVARSMGSSRYRVLSVTKYSLCVVRSIRCHCKVPGVQ